MTKFAAPQEPDHPPLRGFLYAALVVATWTGFICASRAGGISPLASWDIIAIRYGTAVLILLPVWWLRRSEGLAMTRLIPLAVVGGLGYAMLAFAGFELSPASHAAILLPGLLPFGVAVFAWCLLGEAPAAMRLLGLSVIATGVFFLMSDAFGGEPTVLRGDLMLVGASACWACYSVLLRRWAVSPWDATVGVTFLTATTYLPIYFVALPHEMSSASWSDIATQAIYQGVVATIIQMALYVRTIELIGPTRLGVLMAMVPALAAVAAVPLLNEPLSPPVIAGLVLVCAGACVGNLRSIIEQRKRPCPT